MPRNPQALSVNSRPIGWRLLTDGSSIVVPALPRVRLPCRSRAA